MALETVYRSVGAGMATGTSIRVAMTHRECMSFHVNITPVIRVMAF